MQPPISLRPQHCAALFILIRWWIQFWKSAVEIDFSASDHTKHFALDSCTIPIRLMVFFFCCI